MTMQIKSYLINNLIKKHDLRERHGHNQNACKGIQANQYKPTPASMTPLDNKYKYFYIKKNKQSQYFL